MRPTLFRLASDTEDNDEALGEPQAELAFTSPAPPQYPHLEGATTRGPHSPALTLGFCTLRKKEELRWLVKRLCGPGLFADTTFTAYKLHWRKNYPHFTAGAKGGE